ncbi:HAD family phosphatase [Gracilibacillus oryzae]|uniref:HAD family phosphatase n=1 Tax=Gracilibacillus oryzae TaxID=1672701 RepID=A0A7C8KSJ6_9BACI|nr:Cof-type HAD-IIB family hydrolase [Gracilibacillus oryzae]KAB8137650.1 HAD family phosphatase [Gracilibacillus oryzae]
MSFMPKALCLDMDGTLLNNHNQITDRTFEMIQKIREKGIKVFIVTGRSLEEVKLIVPETTKLDGIVTANGMITNTNEELLLEHELPTTIVDKVIESARANQIYYEVHPNNGQRITLEQDKTYMTELIQDPKPLEVGINEWMDREIAVKDNYIDWVKELPRKKYSKMYCFSTSQEKMEQWIKQLDELKMEEDFTTSSSSFHNVEVMVSGVNKATGIKALLDFYNIQPEDTMAIGDSNNDLPMMRYVGYPVGMKNGTDQIKELVKEVTSYTNNEEGVYHFLADYFA